MNIISTHYNLYAAIAAVRTAAISECQSQHVHVTIPFFLFRLSVLILCHLISLENKRSAQTTQHISVMHPAGSEVRKTTFFFTRHLMIGQIIILFLFFS